VTETNPIPLAKPDRHPGGPKRGRADRYKWENPDTGETEVFLSMTAAAGELGIDRKSLRALLSRTPSIHVYAMWGVQCVKPESLPAIRTLLTPTPVKVQE